MATEKDKISRRAFTDPDTDMLSRLLSMKITKAENLPPRVRQTIEEREADTVLLLHTAADKKFILHMEFQSSNDAKMVMRMAIYDYLLHEQHRLDVLGIVIYLGKEKADMQNEIKFFGNYYSCLILDIRELDPQLFINSRHPRQVIFALLADNDQEDKAFLIRQILHKLQVLSQGSAIQLREYLIEMEYLAQTRSEQIQQLIKKEVHKMPITLPVENSLIFQEIAAIVEQRGRHHAQVESAERMIKDGVELTKVHEYTHLDMALLLQIQNDINLPGRTG